MRSWRTSLNIYKLQKQKMSSFFVKVNLLEFSSGFHPMTSGLSTNFWTIPIFKNELRTQERICGRVKEYELRTSLFQIEYFNHAIMNRLTIHPVSWNRQNNEIKAPRQ